MALVRQVKPGKGGEEAFETFQMRPNPQCSGSGKGWPPTGSESCVVLERSSLRSVDSERVSLVMEPRKMTESWEPKKSND